MRHRHLCFDCGRVIKRACRSTDCVFEPDSDDVFEQCWRCDVRDRGGNCDWAEVLGRMDDAGTLDHDLSMNG